MKHLLLPKLFLFSVITTVQLYAPPPSLALMLGGFCPNTGSCGDLDHDGDGEIGDWDYGFHYYVCGMPLKDFQDFQNCFGAL